MDPHALRPARSMGPSLGDDADLRRPRGLFGHTAFIVLLIACWSTATDAQVLPLKRGEIAAARPDECPILPIRESGRGTTSTVTDSLLSEGSRAAILGDQDAARDLFVQAASLDPSNPVVSYRLARTLDERGENDPAVIEYCRYLNLAPTAGDAAEVRARVRDLVVHGARMPDDPWRVAMNAGIESYEAGRFDLAVTAFATAVEIRPGSSDARFNRATANLVTGDFIGAVQDYVIYLEMVPDAPDRAEVTAHIDALRGSDVVVSTIPAPLRIPQPGSALIQGLIVPGLGQYATGRTGWGVVVLGAVGGAAYVGSRTEVVTRVRGAHDPFGNYYEYEVEVVERPHQIPAFGTAAGIAILGALESYFFARRNQRFASDRFGPSSVGTASGSAVTLSLTPTGDRLRLGARVPTGGR